jgi:hypothetical protein
MIKLSTISIPVSEEVSDAGADHPERVLRVGNSDHSLISTTGDIYTDWDIDQLTETLRGMLDEAER